MTLSVEIAVGLVFVLFLLAFCIYILMSFFSDIFPFTLPDSHYGMSYLIYKPAALRYHLHTIISLQLNDIGKFIHDLYVYPHFVNAS